VRVGPIPTRVDPPRPATGPVVLSAAILRTDSLQAWAEVAFPNRTVRVIDASDRGVRPALPGAITLVVPGTRRIALPLPDSGGSEGSDE
jgi:hypothetical protein